MSCELADRRVIDERSQLHLDLQLFRQLLGEHHHIQRIQIEGGEQEIEVVEDGRFDDGASVSANVRDRRRDDRGSYKSNVHHEFNLQGERVVVFVL